MIQGVATVIIDLGNSSTKCTVLFGKDGKTGKYRERSFEIPNVFAPINEGYVVSGEYDTQTSTILRVDTSIGGASIKGCYCNGELQRKEKPLVTIKPSATAKKYTLASTALSYRLAFLFASKAILAIQRSSDFSQLDITWKVVTLLPPGDLEAGSEAIKDVVAEIDCIDSVYPEANIPIKIEKVVVLPEGYCAYAAVVYDKGMTFRQDYSYLTEETVLVFDIGAGTTDCLIVQNNKLVQNSKYTVTQGGNNVFQLVRKKLRLNGLDLSDDVIREGVITGFVKDGAQQVNIANYINEAKDEIAQKIISEFQDFLELTDIRVRSLGYILICGGGSMQDSDNSEVKPLSEKIIENIKILTPHAVLIDLPTHIVTKDNEDGTTTKVEEKISPRELNLIGASILAETF